MMIWVLYLALVVASVIGDERSESKEQVDPLKYNPHEQVYKYDGNKREEEILDEFNSPDYSQPTLVLDYRYMKTGGREYVQGPGGQFIILPHHVKSPQKTKFKNFDELLNYLQHKQHNKGHDERNKYDYHHEDRRQHLHRHDDRRHDDDHHDDRHRNDGHHDDRHHNDGHNDDRQHDDRRRDEDRYNVHRYKEHSIHRDHEY